MSLAQAIVLSASDNVAVANGRIEAGSALPLGAIAATAIESGHKVAIRDRKSVV